RRHQPHVLCGRAQRAGPAPDRSGLRVHVDRHRAGEAGRALRRHRPRHSNPRREAQLLGGARVLRPRHRPQFPRGAASTALWHARHRHGLAARHDHHHRAHDQRRQAAHPPAQGRLDRSDPRSQPVGAVGAHRSGHRGWLRGADPAAGRLCLRPEAAVPGASAGFAADRRLLDTAALDAALERGASPLELFKTTLLAGQDELLARFRNGVSAAQLVPARAWLVDQLVTRTWRRLLGGHNGAALIAVGGYGRGELHPASDIDLLILLPESGERPPLERLEGFVRFLWDIGLEVGHSVRSLDDCAQAAEADITVATSLMESRLLAGPAELHRAMRERTGPARLWPSRRFFEAKWQEQQRRHQKYDDTAHNLEPNVKEGPGGLRDIHVIGWVAKRHFGAETLRDLIGHGFLTEEEYRELSAGQAFLWDIRFALHSLTGRREDRLLFDYQTTLAKQFGHRDEDHNL